MTSRLEEFISSWGVMGETMIKKWDFQKARKREYEAEEERIWKKHAKYHHDSQLTPFVEKPFGLPFNKNSYHKNSAVSIGLFNGNVMLYACSGTAVQYLNDKLQLHHTIFVTTKYLAHNFENYRTRDDNLKIRVRLPNNDIISGFLGLYDDNIAIVTAFTLAHVYPVNTEPDYSLPLKDTQTYAFGRTYDGNLMGEIVKSPFHLTEGVVSFRSAITQAGLGGPVILRDTDGNEQFIGVMVEVSEVKFAAKYLQTELVDEALQRFAQSVNQTTYFRGYSLPQGIKSVVPAGFKIRSLILKSMGYPLPPPLVFELCGSLVGMFEEMFGELHACEGFPWDLYDYGSEAIWERLGKDVVQNLSGSVVSISSFKGDVRCFACTGLLITSKEGQFVLTSASLLRTDDADGNIDPTLMIEVFLSKEHVPGQLVMYHQGYNIAIVSLLKNLEAVFAQDIFKVPKSSKSKEVVAIGRPTKEHEGLLMASKGNLKCRRNKNQGSVFDCKDLKLSTCKIKKVGIGGPLIRFEDGSFVGMNFYDESGPTPYLPRSKIVEVLKRGFNLLSQSEFAPPIILDMHTKGYAAKKNRWPVPKPYWYLAGNVDVLDKVVGKVPM